MAHSVLLRMGPRKQPPHHVEVKAAEQNVSKLRHEVYLPNDTSEVSAKPGICSKSQASGGCKTHPHHPSVLFVHLNRSIV